MVMSGHAGQFLRVDTRTATGIGPWLDACGLPETGNGHLMQKGFVPVRGQAGAPMIQAPNIFAWASQALG